MLGWSPTGSGKRIREARPARCFPGDLFSDTNSFYPKGYYPKSVKSSRGRTSYLRVKRSNMKTNMVGGSLPPFLMTTESL